MRVIIADHHVADIGAAQDCYCLGLSTEELKPFAVAGG